jgi:RNA polymerase sigma factor (sigma-70 family)
MMRNMEDHVTADRLLVNRALQGESAAFHELIQLTEKIIADICFKMVSHTEDIKDLVQEIYFKAWKNLPGFRFQCRITTWIAQIAYNTCFNYLKSRKLVLLIDSAGFEQADELFGRERDELYSQSEIQSAMDLSDTRRMLEKALDSLSPMYKTAITLYHYHDLSYEEIALITSLPVGTVKSHLYRARKNLKDYLLKSYKKEEL